MYTNSNRAAEAQSGAVCASPTLGGLLTAHVVGLLEDSAAEEVEDHLLDCLHCRNKYLMMLNVLGAAPGLIQERGAEDARVLGVAKVVSIADFKRSQR